MNFLRLAQCERVFLAEVHLKDFKKNCLEYMIHKVLAVCTGKIRNLLAHSLLDLL